MIDDCQAYSHFIELGVSGSVQANLLLQRVDVSSSISPSCFMNFGKSLSQVQTRVVADHAPARFKLWLGSPRRTFEGAEALYWAVRPLLTSDTITATMAAHGLPVKADDLQRAA